MNPTRDRRVLQLFEQALELPADQIAKFLDNSCGDDESMRADVAALLATQQQADDLFRESTHQDAFAKACELNDVDSRMSHGKQSVLARGGLLAQRYAIMERIGIGGMGEVYRGADARLDRDVAIKVLNTTAQNDQNMQQRFDREVKSVAALSHPNIVTLYDIADEGDIQFAVMELVDGKTLRQLIADGIDWQDAVSFAHGIANGLSAAHSKNLMHRDIKPDNVIVTSDGTAKILDFGLARSETLHADQELTVSGLAAGTIPYMSPEQAKGKELTCVTDIFSFGTVLFEMLTGVNPFRADTALQTLRLVGDAQPAELTSFVSELPSGLISLVSSMLSHDPSHRPSASEIADRCLNLEETSVNTEPLPPPTPTNLSLRPTDLTGRDDEIEKIISSLNDHPIVTIVGPGGVGKTSVATEVARTTIPKYPGGVWFCDLAPVKSADDVADVLMSVLDGNAGSKGALDQLYARLAGNPTLLVFDNCEHVIEAAAEFAETLSRQVTELTILATSRESLNVDCEFVMRLDGLTCEGTSSDAANLFVTRATARTGYEDSPQQHELVKQIVTKLDGLPLAIELAAARLSVMSLEELLDALSDQIATLRTHRRSQDRQATLEQAIAWSFDLLAEDEQEMLLSLSVFAASFTSDAAAAVCDLNSKGTLLLQRLVEQSVLARTERKGISRYRLLEPIRQFCQVKIDSDLLAQASCRHAHYYAARAGELGKGIYGENEILANDALNTEWPDLRKAVAWGREHGVIEIAIDPIVALNRTMIFQIRVEAYQWMNKALHQFGEAATGRADVQSVIGSAMWVKGDIELANQHLSLSDRIEPTTRNMFVQYSVLFSQNRFQEAWELIQRAGKLASSNGDQLECRWLSIPFAASTLTMVDSTDPRIDESIATASPAIAKLDWPTGKAYLLMIRGFVAMTRGDQATAAASMNQSLELCHSCGNRGLAMLIGFMLNGMTEATNTAEQRLESAVTHLKTLIDSGVETGDLSFYPAAVRSLIVAMVDCGQLEAAATCSAIIDSLKGSGDHNEMTPQFLPAMEKVSKELGVDEFIRLQGAGEHFTVQDIANLGEQLL